jgi:prephenate dehydratase
LISKTAIQGKKGSLCFTLDHTPGSLVGFLSQLAGSNLTHIVSRPIPGKPFEYLFYVDFEGPMPNVNAKHLGSYETISHWRD